MASDPQHCPARGCEETAGHAGPHVCYLASFATFDTERGPATLTLTSSWTTDADKHVEVSVSGDVAVTVALTRGTQDRIARVLAGKRAR